MIRKIVWEVTFGETSFRERKSLRKKVSYHLVLQHFEVCPLRFAFARSDFNWKKEVFVRSLKAVLEFDSFVSFKRLKSLIIDSILSQLKSQVVGDGFEHFFRLTL